MKSYRQLVQCIVALTWVCSLPSTAAFAPPSRPSVQSSTTLQATPPSRRSFLSTLLTTATLTTTTSLLLPAPSHADDAALLADLTTSLQKISTIPPLLQQAEWDKVRTILKTPPVNSLWNLGESSNPLTKLAKSSGDMELMELKDELSISLQMTDQYSYDNVFIYYQPGNGKVKVKEPMEMAEKAIGELKMAIEAVSK